MPMYEYICRECGTEFEELMPSSAAIPPPCPECSSIETDRKMSRFGSIGGSSSGGGGGSSCGRSGFS